MNETNPTPEKDPEEQGNVVSQENYEDVVEKLASKTQNETNLVAEIKELREKKRIAETDAESLKEKLAKDKVVESTVKDINPTTVEEITRQTLAAALAERDAETTKTASNTAMSTFVNSHKEFHPDNDVGGIKMAALEKKLAMFNTSGLRNESDFRNVLEEASRLISSTEVKEQPSNPTVTEPTGSGAAVPKESQEDKLTSQELQIIDRVFDGNRERYIKQKAKRPDYVRTLLRYNI